MSLRRLWHRLTALAAVGCVLLCLGGCQEAGVDGSFYLPLATEPRQLDPQVSSDAASVEIEMALFEGLTRLNEQGQPEPAAATWTVSEDGCRYTFTLKDSAWSDGVAVTAMDFVYGFRRAADPATASPLRERLSGIKGAKGVLAGKKSVYHLGVTAPGADTLVIELTKPDPAFLEKLAAPPFFPCRESFFTSCKGRYGLEQEYVLGNGPFALTRWKHGSSLTLTRSDAYREAETVLPSLVRYVIGDGGSRLSALTGGSLDVAPLVSETEVTAAESAGMTVTALRDTVYGLWFNCRLPLLKKAAVRTALRDAVEWETLQQDLPAVPAVGYIPPDSVLADGSAYRTEENALVFETKENASARLKQALGSAAAPQFTLLCTEEELPLARDIVQSWQKNLALYFTLETVSAETLQARLQTGNYQLALGTLKPGGGVAADALACFTSEAITGNYAGFANQSYNALVKTAERGGRAEAEAAEQALYRQCPMIPLAFESTYYGVNPYVEQLTVRPFGGGNHGAVFGFTFAKKTED